MGGLFDIFSDVTSMMNIAITLKSYAFVRSELSAGPYKQCDPARFMH